MVLEPLGGFGCVKPAHLGGQDTEVELKANTTQQASLFRLSDATGQLTFTHVATGSCNYFPRVKAFSQLTSWNAQQQRCVCT